MANRYKISSLMRLPIELQTEIFLRLPLTSLLVCKRVCKAFHSLIQNPDFRNNHENTSLSLLLQIKHKHENSRKIDHTSHVLVSIDSTKNDMISFTSLVPPIPYTGILFLVGSCNGLVCFVVRTQNMYQDDILLLWNPAVTEQYKYIRLPDIERYSHQRIMEFYFVPETNDYNVLSIGFDTNRYDAIYLVVYKMRTNSWKVVDWIRLESRVNFRIIITTDYCKRERATSVFLNGSFYWIFSSKKSSEIVSFNLKDEKLALIKTIDHISGVRLINDDIGIIDESLALLRWSYGSNSIKILVMTNNRVQDSWVLKYKLSHDNVWLEGFWNNSVLTSDQHSLYFYDTKALMMKKLIPLPENSYLSGFCSFSIPWLQLAG